MDEVESASADLSVVKRLFAHEVLGPLLYSALALFLAAAAMVLFTPLIASNAATLAFAIFIYFIVPGYCVLLLRGSFSGLRSA